MIHVSCANYDYRYSVLSTAFRIDLEHQLTKQDRESFIQWCKEKDPFVLEMVDRINSHRETYNESDFAEIRRANEKLRITRTLSLSSRNLPIIKDTSTP